MNNNFNLKKMILCAMTLSLISACTTAVPVPHKAKVTNQREVTQNLPGAILNQITVEDLRVTSDLMARDLVLQSFLYSGDSPPIIAVKPIENKTDLIIDPDIFQKTIRVKLMERSGGNRILFRDEASHDYTIEERLNQSGTVQMTRTTSTRKRSNTMSVGAPLSSTQSTDVETTLSEYGQASKRVAAVDYFLTGLVYSSTEVARVDATEGMRYFQFQFRLTDARSNIIMWEKEYTVKRQARFN